jgi:hypothetical protein
MSDVIVLCDICGKISRHTCRMCGKRVCDEHYDLNLHICTSCKAGRNVSAKLNKINKK